MRIGTLKYEGPIKLTIRTLRNRKRIATLLGEMMAFASALIRIDAHEWVEEYYAKYGEYPADRRYFDFINPKRGAICELVSSLYENNEFGMYIYNDEQNKIRFAYYDGEMKDRGTLVQRYVVFG